MNVNAISQTLANAAAQAIAGTDAAQAGDAASEFEQMLQQMADGSKNEDSAASKPKDTVKKPAADKKQDSAEPEQQPKTQENVPEGQYALAVSLVTSQPVAAPVVVGQLEPEEVGAVEMLYTAAPEEAGVTQQTVMPETVSEMAGQQPEAPQEQQAAVQEAAPQTAEFEAAKPELQQAAEDVDVAAETEAPRVSARPADEEVTVEDAPAAEQAPVFGESEAVPVKVAEPVVEPEAAEAPEQLAHHIEKALADGESRVTVSLTPENLGRLTVEVTRTADGAISVVLSTSNERAASLLERHSSGLQHLLGDGSQTMVRVEVENRMEESGRQQFLNPDDQNQQHGQQQRREQPQQSESQDFIQQLRLGLIDAEQSEE